MEELKLKIVAEDAAGPTLKATKTALETISSSGLTSADAMKAAGQAVEQAKNEFVQLILSGKATADELKRTEQNVRVLETGLDQLKDSVAKLAEQERKEAAASAEVKNQKEALKGAVADLAGQVSGGVVRLISFVSELKKTAKEGGAAAAGLMTLTAVLGAIQSGLGRVTEAIKSNAAEGQKGSQAIVGSFEHVDDATTDLITSFTDGLAPAFAGIAQIIVPLIDDMSKWIKEGDNAKTVSIGLVKVFGLTVTTLQVLSESYGWVTKQLQDYRYAMGDMTDQEMAAADAAAKAQTRTYEELQNKIDALTSTIEKGGAAVDDIVDKEAQWASGGREVKAMLEDQLAAVGENHQKRIEIIKRFEQEHTDIIANAGTLRFEIAKMRYVEEAAAEKDAAKLRLDAGKETAEAQKKQQEDELKTLEETLKLNAEIYEKWAEGEAKRKEKEAEDEAERQEEQLEADAEAREKMAEQGQAFIDGEIERIAMLNLSEEESDALLIGHYERAAASKIFTAEQRKKADLDLLAVQKKVQADKKKLLDEEVKQRTDTAKKIIDKTIELGSILVDSNKTVSEKIKAILSSLTQSMIGELRSQVTAYIEAQIKQRAAALLGIGPKAVEANSFLPFPASVIAAGAAVAALTIIAKKVGLAGGGTVPSLGMQDTVPLGGGAFGMPGEEMTRREVAEPNRKFLKDLNQTGDLAGAAARAGVGGAQGPIDLRMTVAWKHDFSNRFLYLLADMLTFEVRNKDMILFSSSVAD